MPGSQYTTVVGFVVLGKVERMARDYLVVACFGCASGKYDENSTGGQGMVD